MTDDGSPEREDAAANAKVGVHVQVDRGEAMELWDTNRQKTRFVAVNEGEKAVNDVLALLLHLKKAPAERGLIYIFIRSSVPKKKAFV